MITEWNLNERVKITKESWLHIRNSSRSVLCYPDDRYVAIAYRLMTHEIKGSVSMKFQPGYEVNVTFDDGTILQVKDHWIEAVVGESAMECCR